MAQWMKMLLADGLKEAGEEVFSSDVIFETREPVNAYTPKDYTFLPPKYIHSLLLQKIFLYDSLISF